MAMQKYVSDWMAFFLIDGSIFHAFTEIDSGDCNFWQGNDYERLNHNDAKLIVRLNRRTVRIDDDDDAAGDREAEW